MKVYVPLDSAAVALGADALVTTIKAEAARRGVLVKSAIDRIGGEHDGQRQVTAGDAFRQAHQVWPDFSLPELW